MNKKDYDEIAKIIKNNTFNQGIGHLDEGSYALEKHIRSEIFIKELADYFEKEDNQNVNVKYDGMVKKQFNREQFLKDCGVKE
jgi:hypothetical protein